VEGLDLVGGGGRGRGEEDLPLRHILLVLPLELVLV
jgi:hypothetical protein